MIASSQVPASPVDNTPTVVLATEISWTRQQDQVLVTLQGIIAGEKTAVLQQTLKSLLQHQEQSWMVDMTHLQVLSLRGVRILAKFARILRKRGWELRVQGENLPLYFMLKEMNLDGLFSWSCRIPGWN